MTWTVAAGQRADLDSEIGQGACDRRRRRRCAVTESVHRPPKMPKGLTRPGHLSRLKAFRPTYAGLGQN